ncbi:MAG: ubiquinone biosynthesis protein UbiB [Caulobacter sp.]|nr:ubiquinone biosynthesis protein UbiB [Caulobacter sp.]
MASDRQIIADILRVDHAGEFGAIRIYKAQRLAARWRAPDLLAFLDHTLGDERAHRRAFEALMAARGVTPCRTLTLWGVGGYLLGLATGCLGRAAILICTEAVERTVHRHLDDQVRWLADRDPEISAAITAIQVEELEHLTFATDHATASRARAWAGLLDALVGAATEALIWCSTYGASSRMGRQVRGPR